MTQQLTLEATSTTPGIQINFYQKNPSDVAFGNVPLNPAPVPLNAAGKADFIVTGLQPGHVYEFVSKEFDPATGLLGPQSNEVTSVEVPFGPTPTVINMGDAAAFLVLAGSTITNTGPTIINGDIGVAPGSSITGFPPGSVSGVMHSGGAATDFVSPRAQAALTAAIAAVLAAANPPGLGVVRTAQGPFIVTSVATSTSGTALYTGTFTPGGLGGGLVGGQAAIAGFTNAGNNGTFATLQSTPTTITVVNANATAEVAPGTGASASFAATTGSASTPLPADIGGMTLTPGVYDVATSLGITGTVILDGLGDPNSVFIIRAGSTIITAAGSNVVLTNGAQASNVFWLAGSSATLGVGSTFAGTLMAKVSITATTDAVVNGRLLAQSGAVTLDTNTVSMFASSSQLVIWAPNLAVSQGSLMFDCVSQSWQWATTGGITGATRPIFNTGPGSTTTDGTVIWSDPPPSVLILGPIPSAPPNVPPPPPAPPPAPTLIIVPGSEV
jgi:hypothetical protein